MAGNWLILGQGDVGAHLRPTTDRVRENLFNLLAHGDYPDIKDTRVLDLFGGNGRLGSGGPQPGCLHMCNSLMTAQKPPAYLRENIEILGV